eukprot:8779707-Pyramimonas_sp.AAC.1
MPRLPISLRREGMVAPEPLMLTPTNAKRIEGKNKRGGKGKDMVCRSYRETGKYSRGKECWFAKTTPGHLVT